MADAVQGLLFPELEEDRGHEAAKLKIDNEKLIMADAAQGVFPAPGADAAQEADGAPMELDEYERFVGKFKPKKTTDDCYTPPAVMDAVTRWVDRRVEPIGERWVIRPFRTGGDFTAEDYNPGGAGAVVIDNPPFSILSRIIDWYLARGVDFFLFAPGLTAGNYLNRQGVMVVVVDARVTYENGAVVNTGFLTNMGPARLGRRVWVSGELNEEIRRAQPPAGKEQRRIELPPQVTSVARLGAIARGRIELTLEADEVRFIRGLDSMKGKGFYGCGLLLSEEAAARVAAARAAAAREADVYELSEREKELIAAMGREIKN